MPVRRNRDGVGCFSCGKSGHTASRCPAQGVQHPSGDQDLRWLAGEAKPAKVTICDDSHLSPSIEGTLSSPDLAGKLCPVVPAGIPPPVGPCWPVWDDIPV